MPRLAETMDDVRYRLVRPYGFRPSSAIFRASCSASLNLSESQKVIGITDSTTRASRASPIHMTTSAWLSQHSKPAMPGGRCALGHRLNQSPLSRCEFLANPVAAAEQVFRIVTSTNADRRMKLVWEIDRRLQEDGARPIIMHNRNGTCGQRQVRGIVQQVNSIYNNWRMEDVWIDK
jgi:hypothetical protein